MNESVAPEIHRSRRTTLGELPIQRALPVRGRRTVGAWCFLDRYGPLAFSDEKPMDVAPHPHIGLQTVSWLMEGEVLHRDTLGCEGMAKPGGVNVMTAGRGIAHSEETPQKNVGRLNGLQLWIALPDAARKIEPSFRNVPSVPRYETRDGHAQVIAGELEGRKSDAPIYSDLVGLDLEVGRSGTLVIPARHDFEYAVYLLSGDALLAGQRVEAEALHYFAPGRSEFSFVSAQGARLLVLGGVPFNEPILMWWNFVARTREEIAEARTAWVRREGFGEVRGYDGPRIEAPALMRLAEPNPAS